MVIGNLGGSCGSIFDDKAFLEYLKDDVSGKFKYLELKYITSLSLYSKKAFFDYSLGGYSHRER
jgi:hypothetical protein